MYVEGIMKYVEGILKCVKWIRGISNNIGQQRKTGWNYPGNKTQRNVRTKTDEAYISRDRNLDRCACNSM